MDKKGRRRRIAKANINQASKRRAGERTASASGEAPGVQWMRCDPENGTGGRRPGRLSRPPPSSSTWCFGLGPTKLKGKNQGNQAWSGRGWGRPRTGPSRYFHVCKYSRSRPLTGRPGVPIGQCRALLQSSAQEREQLVTPCACGGWTRGRRRQTRPAQADRCNGPQQSPEVQFRVPQAVDHDRQAWARLLQLRRPVALARAVLALALAAFRGTARRRVRGG
jgi:hypothetical protein